MGAYHKPYIQDFPENPKQNPSPNPQKFLGWRVCLLFAFFVMALTWADVVEWADGVPKLKPFWKDKLERERREIETAEQYALKARRPGMYPCYLCPSKTSFLKAGELWKYGVTRKGQPGRYSEIFLQDNGLYYEIQFVGNYAQCLEMEKLKLYHYPVFPENLARPDSLKLLFPPGNKQAN